MPRYNEQAQKLIFNVASFFENERNRLRNGQTFVAPDNYLYRASMALQVSEPTIVKIKKNEITKDQEYTENMSRKMRIEKTKITEYLKCTIREVIYKMYDAKDHVTMHTLHNRLREELDDGFPYSRASLHRWCIDIGFRWKQSSSRYHLMEQPDIRMKRQAFLREYMRNKDANDKLDPVFIDETWIFSKGSHRRSWQDGTLRTASKKSGEGCRYIVVHAGNSEGFIPNGSLVFKSHSKSGDYHDNMNRTNFEKWFKTQLVPHLKTHSLIVMDNASYHSGLEEMVPTKSWTKKKLIDWLLERNIDFPENCLKCDLWKIVSSLRPAKKYHLDEWVKQFGHRILRLPPYHCQFNAIELVWSEAKRNFDNKIVKTRSTPDEILATWNTVLDEVTPEKWRKYIGHAEKLITAAWNLEKKWDASDIQPLIININNPEEDSSSYSEFSSDDLDSDDL